MKDCCNMKQCFGLCTEVPETEVTEQRFRQWLLNDVATKSGGIGKDELREALQSFGMLGVKKKAKKGMRWADLNRDGRINEHAELDALIDYAVKHWNIKVTM